MKDFKKWLIDFCALIVLIIIILTMTAVSAFPVGILIKLIVWLYKSGYYLW